MPNRPIPAPVLVQILHDYFKRKMGLRATARRNGVSVPTVRHYVEQVKEIIDGEKID
jgi:DNA-binding CsgD family transcriptional regulator